MGPGTPRSEHRLFCRRPCVLLEIQTQRDSSQDMGLNLQQEAKSGTGYLSPEKQNSHCFHSLYDPGLGLHGDSSCGPDIPDKHWVKDNTAKRKQVLCRGCRWRLRFLGLRFCLGLCECEKIPCRIGAWEWSNCVSFPQWFGANRVFVMMSTGLGAEVNKTRSLACEPSGQMSCLQVQSGLSLPESPQTTWTAWGRRLWLWLTMKRRNLYINT